MKKYLMLLIGYGEGCDYTIGCNMNYEEFEAQNNEEAIKKMYERCEDYGASYDFENYNVTFDGISIEKVILYEINNKQEILIKEPIEKAYKEYKDKENKDEEYKEYLKLKDKYEN